MEQRVSYEQGRTKAPLFPRRTTMLGQQRAHLFRARLLSSQMSLIECPQVQNALSGDVWVIVAPFQLHDGGRYGAFASSGEALGNRWCFIQWLLWRRAPTLLVERGPKHGAPVLPSFVEPGEPNAGRGGHAGEVADASLV